MLGNLFSTYAGERDAEAFQISRKSGEVQSETLDRIRPVPITWDAVAPQSSTQELALCELLALIQMLSSSFIQTVGFQKSLDNTMPSKGLDYLMRQPKSAPLPLLATSFQTPYSDLRPIHWGPLAIFREAPFQIPGNVSSQLLLELPKRSHSTIRNIVQHLLTSVP